MVLKDEIKKQILAMKEQGFNKKQTCDQLKVSFPTVNKIWNEGYTQTTRTKYPIKIGDSLEINLARARNQKELLMKIVLNDGLHPELEQVDKNYIVDVLTIYRELRSKGYSMDLAIENTYIELHV